jgi:hypothetical protein
VKNSVERMPSIPSRVNPTLTRHICCSKHAVISKQSKPQSSWGMIV